MEFQEEISKTDVAYVESDRRNKSIEHPESQKSQKRSKLTVISSTTRSKSPITVQEWVAALPDESQEKCEEDKKEVEATVEDNDNLNLGAEAGGYTESTDSGLGRPSNVRLGMLQHSDTLTSVLSDMSQASTTSVDSVLQSREADPETVLQNLGFAGSDALARIPVRFLQQPSKAKGITVEAYKKQQDELNGRFESGFFGFRGLQGSLHRRPSQLVEKILEALKEKELQRKGSALSWCSQLNSSSSSIPARFKKMNPERTTFNDLVAQVSSSKESGRKTINKSFKSLAKSVLSAENREWRKEQIETNKKQAAQLLIIGGKSFLVDEDGNEEEIVQRERDVSRSTVKPRIRKLTKQDSLHSLQSNDSAASDWSDEEDGDKPSNLEALSKRSENLKRRTELQETSRAEDLEKAQLVYSRSCERNGNEDSFTENCIPEEILHGKHLY